MMKDVKWILMVGLIVSSSVSFAQNSTLRLEKRADAREYQTKNRNQEPIILLKTDLSTFNGQAIIIKKEVAFSSFKVGEQKKEYILILTKSDDIDEHTYQLREVSEDGMQISRRKFAEEHSRALDLLGDRLRIQIELIE